MPSNLALFPFTDHSNTASAYYGWYVETGVAVDALAGNDEVSGEAKYYYGILNKGTINTDEGDDLVSGTSYYKSTSIPNVGIGNIGTIDTGTGNDIITGSGPSGIRNGFMGSWPRFWEKGNIITGIGNDTITGTSTYGDGILNLGVSIINTGAGNDTIKGTSSVGEPRGIGNYGKIDTGRGNDTIISNGIFNARTRIFGKLTIGKIITGAGNDIISCISINNDSLRARGISNDGTIYTGAGKDMVDSLRAGFTGNGKTYLGANDDILKGFGNGNFYGGTGTDKILLGEGDYYISGTTIASSPGLIMYVNEFEKIGGANGGLFNYANGTLTVNSDGVATFAA